MPILFALVSSKELQNNVKGSPANEFFHRIFMVLRLNSGFDCKSIVSLNPDLEIPISGLARNVNH